MCILNIKPDGSIIVEQFDTITRTTNYADTILGRKQTETYSNIRRGNGTGTYGVVTWSSTNSIQMEIILNLTGTDSNIPLTQRLRASLNLGNDNMSVPINNYYVILKRDGTTYSEGASSIDTSTTFRRIE